MNTNRATDWFRQAASTAYHANKPPNPNSRTLVPHSLQLNTSSATTPSLSSTIPPRRNSFPSRLPLPPRQTFDDIEGVAESSGSSRSLENIPVETGLQTNDWEHVVTMYMTGEGTPDGRPLRDLTRGDGRRVEDRKLLEKRRTIGKTYARLGRDLFERTIGYKVEGNYRRKQRMYLVIARCRVISQLCRNGTTLPTDPDELTELIERKLSEKAARKRAPGERAPMSLLCDAAEAADRQNRFQLG